MHVVATAGHVDHGKSTLVRALTGMEPDRWAEERRRGMTIDLGYAWTTLPSGEQVAFVDVPGHQRFIGNMLAGVGPVPAVLFVVAADEGWRRQSGEHLAAVDALGVRHGLLAVTRSDLADPGPATAEARERIAASSLGEVPAVAVSGTTGAGLDDLRAALDRLVSGLPTPATAGGRLRLWVDRAFTIRGSGTVVTGTLGAGRLALGDTLELAPAGVPVRVRGLESLKQRVDTVDAVARVAVNLRGLEPGAVSRGDALVTPGAWRPVGLADVRLTADPTDLPSTLVLHVGAAGVPVRVRPLGKDGARLALDRPLPLAAGDVGVLRDPGGQRVAAGVLVLDVDPPPLLRRGAAAARAEALAVETGVPDPAREVARRGSVGRAELAALGILPRDAPVPDRTVAVGAERLASPETFAAWQRAVVAAVTAFVTEHPLEPGPPLEATRRTAGLPDLGALVAVVDSVPELVSSGGRVRPAAARTLPPPAAAALDRLRAHLAAAPFAAPEAGDLPGLGLTPPVLGALAADGLVLRLPGDVVLLPEAEAEAVQRLAALPQPFTLSAARQALGTSRRVAVPLLEHLDALRRTRRVDAQQRVVVSR